MMGGVTQISLAEARDCVDVGIVTMKTEEFRAVLQRFPIELEADGKIRYNISTFIDASGKGHAAAVVRTSEQGDLSAQATAASLIEDLRPNLIVLVGIAGASPEREFTLGDVIIANRMYNFTVTAANPDGTIGYSTRSSPAHLVAQTVAANLVADSPKYGEWYSEAAVGMARPVVRLRRQNIAGPESWQRKVRDALGQYFGKDGHDRQPIVFDGPIGSSSTLMKDPKVFMEWLDKARDLKAIDMEISGVFEAARSIEGDLPVIVIRGLSDVVGFRRDSAWTEYACHTAASFCRALITSGAVRVGSKRGAGNPNEQALISIAPTLREEKPADYVDRPELTVPLLIHLQSGDSESGRAIVSLIHGMGGIGKTTIAQWIVWQQEIERRFPDGRIWVTLGRKPPSALAIVNPWLSKTETDEQRALNAFATMLQARAVLLVIDDIWPGTSAEVAKKLLLPSFRSHFLLTTRFANLDQEHLDIHAEKFSVDEMSVDQGTKLIVRKLGRELNRGEQSNAIRLHEIVGGHPLALELAATRVREDRPWDALIDNLTAEVARLDVLDKTKSRLLPEPRRHKTLRATLRLSVRYLELPDRGPLLGWVSSRKTRQSRVEWHRHSGL